VKQDFERLGLARKDSDTTTGKSNTFLFTPWVEVGKNSKAGIGLLDGIAKYRITIHADRPLSPLKLPRKKLKNTSRNTSPAFDMTPTETAAQLRLAADWIEKNIPEQSKPFTLPIQTLAQNQVELTSEMQEAASQVLKEEMQGLDPYADLKKRTRRER